MTGNELLPHMVGLTTVLYQSQYEAAKFFEIAYYSVSNFPDLAVEVRAQLNPNPSVDKLSAVLFPSLLRTFRALTLLESLGRDMQWDMFC